MNYDINTITSPQLIGGTIRYPMDTIIRSIDEHFNKIIDIIRRKHGYKPSIVAMHYPKRIVKIRKSIYGFLENCAIVGIVLQSVRILLLDYLL